MKSLFFNVSQTPEEEENLNHNERLLPVHHYFEEKLDPEETREFKDPFYLKIHNGNTLGQIKPLIKSKLGYTDEQMAKLKFARLTLDVIEELGDSYKIYYQDEDDAEEWCLGIDYSESEHVIENQKPPIFGKPVTIN